MSKRFSEAEAQRIFALAAERQHVTGQAEPGLSLEELEEVGRAAGIDPAFVRAAATDALRPEPTATTKSVLGMPLGFRRERFLRGTVTDDAWARIVVDLRQQFNKPGLVTDIGTLREWRSEATDYRQPVTVTLTPERDGTRVVIERSQAQTALGLGIGAGSNLALGLLFALITAFGEGTVDMEFPATLLIAIGVLFLAGAFVGMRLHGRRQMQVFDTALDRIDRALGDAEHDRHERERTEPTPSGRLDPSLLDAPEPGATLRNGHTRLRE